MLDHVERSTVLRKKNQSRFMPKTGKPTLGIVSANRKTELCRNWQRGCCIYGASKCAFAHGAHELKHQSLDEMENTGRIPNASKFRCYPCLTWVATGSCPYFTRCVFIHDPRIKGPTEAWLYSSSHPKSSASGKGGGGGVGSPFGRDTFYWPDMVRTDFDGKKLPSISVPYDMDPAMLDSEDPTDRAVYRLWYSLVGALMETTEDTQNTPSSIDSTDDDMPDLAASLFTANDTYGFKPPLGDEPFSFSRTQPRQRSFPGSRSTMSTPRSWRTKDESRRLRLFVRMSAGQSISPEYVPMPASIGPGVYGYDTCDLCERTLLESPLQLPQTTESSNGSTISAFPLADVETDHVCNNPPPAPKPIKKKRSWRLDEMGEENQRPPRVPQTVGSGPLPRRSTAPAALGGGIVGTTRRAIGSEVARGLFSECSDISTTRSFGHQVNASFFKNQALGGLVGGRNREAYDETTYTTPINYRRARTVSSEGPSSSTVSFFQGGSATCSTSNASTSSTVSPFTTPPPTIHPPTYPSGSGVGFSAAYPFGSFADGM